MALTPEGIIEKIMSENHQFDLKESDPIDRDFVDSNDLMSNLDVTELDRHNSELLLIDKTLDWYGNTILHHQFANGETVDLMLLSDILRCFPEAAEMKNQFGRIPLHYALDRIRVSQEGVKLLLDCFPGKRICVSF